jgi:hypothetical protein
MAQNLRLALQAFEASWPPICRSASQPGTARVASRPVMLTPTYLGSPLGLAGVTA